MRFRYKAQPLISMELASRFPSFQEDFAVLNSSVLPAYARLDEQAARGQNTARLLECVQLAATTLLTICASARLVFGPGMVRTGLQFAEIVLGLVAGALTQTMQTSTSHAEYLQARRAAERLRRLAFAYLGRQGDYAESTTRQRTLRQHILMIEKEGQRHG